MATKYTHVTTTSQLSTLTSKNSVVIIDFHATWCGPCKVIAPVFESLAAKHAAPSKVAFVKVDVDAGQSVAQQYSVRAMPTFVVLTNGTETARIQGADRSALTAAVETAVRNAKPSYTSGTGHKLGSATPAYIKDGNVAATAPLGRRVGSWVDTVIAFIGLYLVSLLSVDAMESARQSGFAVGPGGGSGGGGGGSDGPGGPGGRKLGTVRDFGRTVGGPACAGGSCG